MTTGKVTVAQDAVHNYLFVDNHRVCCHHCRCYFSYHHHIIIIVMETNQTNEYIYMKFNSVQLIIKFSFTETTPLPTPSKYTYNIRDLSHPFVTGTPQTTTTWPLTRIVFFVPYTFSYFRRIIMRPSILKITTLFLYFVLKCTWPLQI